MAGVSGKELPSGYSQEDYLREGISVSVCARDVKFVPVYQRGKNLTSQKNNDNQKNPTPPGCHKAHKACGGECLVVCGLGEEHRGETAGSAFRAGGYNFFFKSIICTVRIINMVHGTVMYLHPHKRA